MQVVILSGGLGTRLKGLAAHQPKAMVSVLNRPFIQHQLLLLKAQQLTDVLMCIGHFGEQIENFVGNGAEFGMNVQYAKEDPKFLLGTGGALVNAFSQLASEFLLIYGDSYLPTDFIQMQRWSSTCNYRAVMSVYRNQGRWDKSNVRVAGDRVSFYSKKAEMGDCDYIDYGLSYFRKEVLEPYCNHIMPIDLSMIQGSLVKSGQLGAYEIAERFYEVGTPEGIAELEGYFLGRQT